MNVISRKRITDFMTSHPTSRSPLEAWYRIVKKQTFENFNEVRQLFPSADQVKNFVVFNIGGNNYRLIALINYRKGNLFVRHILTHTEYDKNKWKDDSWYT